MNKKIQIEGMTCGHCKMKVENVLGELDSVDSVEVDLIDGIAELQLSGDLEDEFLSKVISDAGYKVVSIDG